LFDLIGFSRTVRELKYSVSLSNDKLSSSVNKSLSSMLGSLQPVKEKKHQQSNIAGANLSMVL
jgi:hypothetical protein